MRQRIAALHVGTQRAKTALEYEVQSITRMTAKIAQIEEEKKQILKAVGVIDRCIQIVSANGIGKIESVVSGGLRMVFNDQSMALVINKKDTVRGTSYELLMRQNDASGQPFLGKPMDSFGGGPVNVIAFLLRVIMVKRFKLAKFLVIDESFNNVSSSGGHLEKVSEMLQKLCHDHGFKILAITHQPTLANAANTMYQVSKGPDGPTIMRVNPGQVDFAEAADVV